MAYIIKDIPVCVAECTKSIRGIA